MSNLKKGVYTLRDMSEMFKSVAKLGSISQVRCEMWCKVLPVVLLSGVVALISVCACRHPAVAEHDGW
jgi:hypothetical protein